MYFIIFYFSLFHCLYSISINIVCMSIFEEISFVFAYNCSDRYNILLKTTPSPTTPFLHRILQISDVAIGIDVHRGVQ